MGIVQSFKLAFKQLLSNKMRSILTMLGIIIGVLSVTLLVSVANSMTESVNSQMTDLGSNLISVMVTSKDPNKQLSYTDAKKFKDIDNIEKISADVSGNVDLKYSDKDKITSIVGTDNNFIDLENKKLSEGRFILPIDIKYNNKVVILGNQIAKDIFGFENPLHKYVKLNGVKYKVVGILDKDNSALNSTNDKIYAPITSVQRLIKNIYVSNLYLKVNDTDSIDNTMSIIEKKLDKIFDEEENSYMLINQQQILDTISSMQGTMKTTVGVIAGISLLVGGIGIMNIMLVSVTERTREIGIRKALGAKRRDILMQFLIESIVISLIGGIIGAILGIIGSQAFNSVLGVTSGISWDIVIFGLVFSMFIGVIFGLMPANKASKLLPIDALRTE
ncbi:MAG: ABC transporter permease [Clostridium baratii]|uniref:FtsX-like permease family protein n=1 Tax=Clostridium baratii str. Sullivan TaxID=1415775 RepID=A0A0A7FXB2_9CLOT|nr:ABC transporter permease [Clostridium baratii]AIY83580.1 ftsX-like permease family protein [Clostridium baratii str. Sullivan]MBS6006053.1 ABC transporter permease [Clostridium baratii]MDU1053122.1 ABC transporter permease [Clostridium baratii]MDU4911799.1 ABC transporter permease [Clostridium baratii]CUP14819.1 lipoprotein release ABC transporter permease [Clostridium baratii]